MANKTHLRFHWQDLVSFEAMFLLFVFAGIFKASEFFASFNEQYDLTVTTTVVGIICGLAVFLRRNAFPSATGWTLMAGYLVYVIYATTSYLFGEYVSQDATIKIQKLVAFNTWGLVAPLFLLNSRQRVERFLRLFLLMTVYLGFDALLRSKGEGLVRSVGVLGVDSYQALGNLMALGVEVVLVAMIFGVTRKTQVLLGVIAAGMTLAMTLSGARQALAGLLVVAAFLGYVLSNSNLTRQFVRRYLPIIVLMPLVFFVIRSYFFHDLDTSWGASRIFGVFSHSSSGILAETGRQSIWQDGIDIWRESPIFGAGFGSFREAASSPDFRHPHNMFVEYLCELGVVGLVLGCGMWWSAFRHLLQRKRLSADPLFLTVCAMWLHTVTVAQFSGDIADNRLMFVFAGLVVAVPRLTARRRTTEERRAVKWPSGTGFSSVSPRGVS